MELGPGVLNFWKEQNTKPALKPEPTSYKEYRWIIGKLRITTSQMSTLNRNWGNATIWRHTEDPTSLSNSHSGLWAAPLPDIAAADGNRLLPKP